MFYTDDPVADYSAYSAAQENWLEKRPICSECGEHIQDDYLYEINDEYICEDCMKEYYRKSVDSVMGW